VATGGVLLLFVHLVEMGLEALGNLLAAAASAVQDAVDAIVDAFCAFVDWAIDVLIDLFNQFVLEPLSALWTSIQNWIVGFAHLIRVNLDGIANGTISFTEAELSMIGYFIDSDTFVLMLVVMTAFLAAMTVLQVAIAPAAFLIGLLAPVIIDLVLMGIAAAIGGYHWLVDSIGGLFSGFIDDAASFLSSEGVQSSMTVITLLAAFGDMFMSKMDMFMKIGDNNGALEKKKQSVFGFIISCFGLGWTMSEHAIHDLDENDKKNYRYLSERPRPRLWSVFMQRRK
jgi:hypothetical protein